VTAVTEALQRALSIAEAAEASGLSAHTLRYYERAGLLELASRNGSGHRRYREAELELVEWKIGVSKERLGRA
jgi:DNA-binding transcriptional MerR regulator